MYYRKRCDVGSSSNLDDDVFFKFDVSVVCCTHFVSKLEVHIMQKVITNEISFILSFKKIIYDLFEL
jgi:hypothetical protein